MDAADLREQLEQRLMSHGVYVTSLDRRAETLRIEYETATPGEGVPRREIGRVLNRLLDALDDGWEATDVRGVVYHIDAGGEDGTSEDTESGDGESDDSASGERGTWRADADWLRAHDRGELSDVDLSQRVLDTVEDA